VSGVQEPNGYSVHLKWGGRGWEVQIREPEGLTVWTRACSDEAEARTLTSTIQQHIYWLSAAKFREYYRLARPA
jgi:hypothetical protein